jgi:hypothetical protein
MVLQYHLAFYLKRTGESPRERDGCSLDYSNLESLKVGIHGRNACLIYEN